MSIPNHPENTAILRMIDANLNRASEGLRMIEDCARFGLNDPALSEQCKTARHQLRVGIANLQLPSDSLIVSRDTMGDVGVKIKTTTEGNRSDGIRDLVDAAAKRSTEALRVIEECAKAIRHSGAPFESIRYQLYTIHRELILSLAPTCPQWTLCVLITQSLCVHYDPSEIVKRAAQGGAQCIQIREKTMPDSQMLDLAGPLTDLAQSYGLDVMINDRVQIAQLVNADGVHLGQDDLPISDARKLLGPRAWIGRTCPTIDDARVAIAEGADTCGLGPVFPSTTKSKPTLAGLDLVTQYLNDEQMNQTPMLAISGINPQNINQLAQIQCPGVAVSSAVCSSENPKQACELIIDAISRYQGSNEPTLPV
ncbi:MAG: thiamine phosphate synthase [Phycisphaerales bacterium]|nr:thiamine phosphate synthase [Phycisphaerales bacterium]